MLKKLLWTFALAVAAASPAHAAVDVNKADRAALETVRGIGPSVSSRILEERRKGLFRDWLDLVERVKGVGEGNAARFSKEGLTVNGAAYASGGVPSKADLKARPAERKVVR